MDQEQDLYHNPKSDFQINQLEQKKININELKILLANETTTMLHGNKSAKESHNSFANSSPVISSCASSNVLGT